MPRTTSFAQGRYINIFTTFKEHTSCPYTTTLTPAYHTPPTQKTKWENRKRLMLTGLKELDVMLELSICRVGS